MLHLNVSDRASNVVRTSRTECKRNGVAEDVVRTSKTRMNLLVVAVRTRPGRGKDGIDAVRPG